MSGTKIEEPTPGAGYGCFKMSEGEKLDSAKEYITNLSKNSPTLWFLDIVCTPNQMTLAQANASYLSGYILGQNPDMLKECVIVAVTVDYMDRPAHNMLQQLLKGRSGPTPNVLEHKEGRRYTYIGGKLWTK